MLRRHDYRMLLASAATSSAGHFLYLVALSVCLFDRTGSAGWVSAAAWSRFLPSVLLDPLAGVVADHYERRALMIAGDIAQLVAMAALTATAVGRSCAAARGPFEPRQSPRPCSGRAARRWCRPSCLLNTADTITFVHHEGDPMTEQQPTSNDDVEATCTGGSSPRTATSPTTTWRVTWAGRWARSSATGTEDDSRSPGRGEGRRQCA